MKNRTYKYADELEEGDIIEHTSGSNHEARLGPKGWCMVHKPRRDGDKIVAILIPLDPNHWVTGFCYPPSGWCEVATMASHPEVIQQLAERISELQSDGGREPAQAPPQKESPDLIIEETAAGVAMSVPLSERDRGFLKGVYVPTRGTAAQNGISIKGTVVEDDDPDADELPAGSPLSGPELCTAVGAEGADGSHLHCKLIKGHEGPHRANRQPNSGPGVTGYTWTHKSSLMVNYDTETAKLPDWAMHSEDSSLRNRLVVQAEEKDGIVTVDVKVYEHTAGVVIHRTLTGETGR